MHFTQRSFNGRRSTPGTAWLIATLSLTHAGSAPLSLPNTPGTLIDHIPASSRVYIGSPSIAVWTNGSYLASHDYFGPGSSRDYMSVFQSSDRGTTWTKISQITNQYWSTLFVHQGHVYLIGTTSEKYENMVIRRSSDGGHSWSAPVDAQTGLLAADGGYHCAPQPVLFHEGRIWRAMEDNGAGGGWGPHFRAFMMSAPADSDLLNQANWTFSNRVPGDTRHWLNGRFNGWLEGNAVLAPDGRIVNMLRVDVRSGPEEAAIINISDDGRRAEFDPATGFVKFPGGAKKFTIRHDPRTRRYWTLATMVHPRHFGEAKPGTIRNTLALTSSADLRDWKIHGIPLYHPDVAKHGFQYVDWLFEGDDMIAVCRTAYDDGLGGAHNNHDANFLTFHRIKRFREMTENDSVIDLPLPDTGSESGEQ